MRTLFIGALAANLVGCICLPYPDRSAAQIASKPVVFKVHAQNAKSTKSTNPQTRSFAQFGKKTKAVAQRAKHTAAMKTAFLPQLNDKADLVTEKAKASVAAMMETPASAEFIKLKRAVKNLLDESVDTICGYVRGKNASGGDTGEMPFLYIIPDDEAYLVNGRSFVAESVHSVLCN